MMVLDPNDLVVASFEPAPAPEPGDDTEESANYTLRRTCSCYVNCPVPISWPNDCAPTV